MSQPLATAAAIDPALQAALDRNFPFPDTCAQCRSYRERQALGAPDHTYGPSRKHRPHCTCDGCF